MMKAAIPMILVRFGAEGVTTWRETRMKRRPSLEVGVMSVPFEGMHDNLFREEVKAEVG